MSIRGGSAGSVTFTKGDIGLGNVDNTSDLNKPIPNSVQSALDTKVTGSGALNLIKVTRAGWRALSPDAQSEYLIVPQAQDDFYRTLTDQWGTADSGHSWTTSPTANFDIASPGFATSVHSAANTDNIATLASISSVDQEIEVWFSLASVTTANNFFFFALLRFTTTNQTYRIRVSLNTSGVVQLTPQKVVAATAADLAAAATVTGLTYTAGMVLGFRAALIGSSPTRLVARIWDASKVEPVTWNMDLTPAITDESVLQAAANAGIYTRAVTGATPVPNTFTIYRFRLI